MSILQYVAGLNDSFRALHLRPRTCAIVAFCIVAATSGGSNTEAGGQDVPIGAGARLAWTQLADSAEALRAHTFRLYVDGRVAELSALRCQAIRSPLSYECAGGLPSMTAGRHVLELTSVVNGSESPRSERFVVIVSVSGGTARLTPVGTAQSSGTSSQVCTATDRECFDLKTIASGLDRVTGLASAADGRLLLVEGGTRLRVIAEGRLLDEPALGLQDARSRIVGLAVDPRRSESQTVYVAWTEPASTGGFLLNVTRYRNLGNSLGEGATIVAGLPFSSGQLAPLAVDEDGLVYLALPEGTAINRDRPVASPFGGAVLRYDRDGRTPEANPRPSPVVSSGYSQPTFLAVDPTDGRIWLAGSSAPGQALSAFSIQSPKGGVWPLRPNVADTSRFTAGAQIATASALALSGIDASETALLVADDRLFVARSTAGGGLTALGELPLSPAVPLTVGGATTGSHYVAVVDEQGTTSILRLMRGQ